MNEKYYQAFLDNNPNPRELKPYRYIEEKDSPIHVYHNGQKMINFSANDYLGLSKHPALIARSQAFAAEWGVGSTSSRLVTGNLALYQQLETDLSKALHKPAALILCSGYQTNISVLEALLDKRVLKQEPIIFCDKYAHVSLLALTQHLGRLLRFQHNNLSHLKSLLEKYRHHEQPKFIVVESIYSMHGDKADLRRLIALAKEHNAFLYVDDAHAVGVYGANGWGCAPEFAADIDVIMGTFSKGLGSFGGYIGCSETLKAYLVNKCRGLIYSTGLSPAVLGAMSAALEVVPSLSHERQQLLNNVMKVRQGFLALGLDCGEGDTHIIPWIIGDADKTQRASALLDVRGILGASIRPPTVSEGKSRIRFCLSVLHGDAEIEKLLSVVQEVKDLL